MVGLGGLPFKQNSDIVPLLTSLTRENNYKLLASIVGQPLHRNIDQLAQDYIDAFHGREPGFGTPIARITQGVGA